MIDTGLFSLTRPADKNAAMPLVPRTPYAHEIGGGVNEPERAAQHGLQPTAAGETMNRRG